jgi:cation:H+ antiporter
VIVALLVFVACGAVVVAAGSVLARQADTIAERTGLGRAWIGTVLLATGTSLPELTTDVAAVRMGAPDLAAGDLFGSSMANMLILALVDLLAPRGRILGGAAFGHALTGCLAIVLNALGAVFVLMRPEASVLGVGLAPLALLAVFLGGTRAVFRQSARAPEAPRGVAHQTLWRAAAAFVAAALAILAAAPGFAWSATQIAERTGLGATFVGTWLVGMSTSLPELVTSLAAIRIGAFDLAIGNLLGSNAFNMVVFLAMDVAQPGGSIFAALSAGHAVTGLLAVVMTATGLAAVVYRAERRFGMLEPSSVVLIATYVLGLWLLYAQTAAP